MINILIVDDVPQNADSIVAYLKKNGDKRWQIAAVYDADSALAYAARRVDVLICKLMLSGSDGFSLHEQLKKRWCGMKTIFHTEKLRPRDAQRAIRTPGVVDCLFCTESQEAGLSAVKTAVEACVTDMPSQIALPEDWVRIRTYVEHREYEQAAATIQQLKLSATPQERINLYHRLLLLYMRALDADVQLIYRERRMPPLFLDDEGWVHTIHVFAMLFADLASAEAEGPQRNSALIAQVEQYARSHLADDLSLNKMATIAGRSVSNLSRVFKQMTGIGYNDYITQLRMLQAAHRLRSSTPMTLDELAVSVGFNSTSYFIRVFREHFGITPAEYRKGCA